MSDHKHKTEECFSVIELFHKKVNSDRGFSGYLHAITGVFSVLLFFLASLLMGFGHEYLKWSLLATIIAFALAWIGATLYPDLDNSKSTSHSALGFIGEGISMIFRASSAFLQTVIRTPKDDASPNPHRGFYHTILSTVLIGLGVWLLTKLPQTFTLPLLGKVTLGEIFATLFLAVMIHLFLSALASSYMKKIRKSSVVGELVAFLLSLSVALVLMHFIEPKNGYLWLAVAIAAGGATHIFGDTFTKYGTPWDFPLAVFTKGRFWWYRRFAKLQSGGEIEKLLIIIFSVASFVIAVILILMIML